MPTLFTCDSKCIFLPVAELFYCFSNSATCVLHWYFLHTSISMFWLFSWWLKFNLFIVYLIFWKWLRWVLRRKTWTGCAFCRLQNPRVFGFCKPAFKCFLIPFQFNFKMISMVGNWGDSFSGGILGLCLFWCLAQFSILSLSKVPLFERLIIQLS